MKMKKQRIRESLINKNIILLKILNLLVGLRSTTSIVPKMNLQIIAHFLQ